jgi:hypothetical protein
MPKPGRIQLRPGLPAAWSRDQQYRYALWRTGLAGHRPGFIQFIGLNPSTANESRDDPTLRRAIGFARRLGFAALAMTNLFAYRATDRAVLGRIDDPIGPKNDRWLLAIARRASLIVACWGADRIAQRRGDDVLEMLRPLELYALDFTAAGHPKHPLYIAYDRVTRLEKLSPPQSAADPWR